MPHSVAYIVGFYPAVSHLFITREVDRLRARGLEVHTFSLHRTPARRLLTAADRRAAAETYVVQPPEIRVLIAAHARALLGQPRSYLQTLAFALRLSPGGIRGTIWQLFYFAEAVLVWDELNRRGIRHVHAHFANAASAVAMLASHLGRRQGLSWSFTMHGPTEFDDVTAYALPEKIRDAEWVACISDYCRSQLMKLVEPEHWDRLMIVHCGVDPDDLVPIDRSARDGGRLEVLCLGRLVPDKGQLVLLEAVEQVRRSGGDVRLTFAGAGPDRAALEARVRGSALEGAVRFLGAVGQDRIHGIYSAADVFCLPSFAEGVPVALMEAMSCGLPVITTRIMGIPELVEDGASGLLVRPGRADEVASSLRRLLGDPALRRTLGDEGRRRVQAEYDIRVSVDRLHALFASESGR